MKRIAVAGSHGVGKTTLANALAGSFTGKAVTLNQHLARTMIGRGYPLGRDATTDSYIQYIILQLTAERTAGPCELFISDRTLLDPLAYAIVNQRLGNSAVPESTIDLLRSVWLLEMRQYALYLFVPIEFDMRADGVRPDGEEYRRSIEDTMRSLLRRYRVPCVTVSGSPEDRRRQAYEAVLRLERESPFAD